MTFLISFMGVRVAGWRKLRDGPGNSKIGEGKREKGKGREK